MKKIFYLLIVINTLIFYACDVEITKSNRKPTKPVLKSPSNNTNEVNINTSLNWDASTDEDGDVLKYNVYLGTDNPPTTNISSSQSETSFTPSLKTNTTYYWQVRVSDGKDGVATSEVWSFTTININPTIPILSTPDNNASNINLNVTLIWSASTYTDGSPVKYNIYLGTEINNTTKVSNLQTSTTFTVTDLLPKTSYYWKIEAVGEKGGVVESEIGKFNTIAPPSVFPLLLPTNFATNVSLNTNLTWGASITLNNNDIKYKVLIDTSRNFNSTLKRESNLQTETTYPLTNLISNTTYYWKIIAVSSNGLITESNVRNFKTSLVPPSIPSLISPLNGVLLESSNTSFSWSESSGSSGNIVKYNVYISTTNPPNNKVSNLQIETTYNTTTLPPNKKYYWKIETDDGNGGLTQSEVDSFIIFIYDIVFVESGTFTASNGYISKTSTLSSFSIGKYEVTQSQWLSIMGKNPSNFRNCDNCPVERVSFDNIENFIQILNNKTGKNYRLPTEAEWEYASKGGKKSKGYKYSGSNDIDSVAWYAGNSKGKTHEVGTTLKANELGIYDMTGNVKEWLKDWYGGFNSISETDPIGPSMGTYKAILNCSWSGDKAGCENIIRGGAAPYSITEDIGFRLVLP